MLSSINRLISNIPQQNNINKNNPDNTPDAGFKRTLSKVSLGKKSEIDISPNNITNVNSYLSQLQTKFGSEISVQNLEKNNNNINHIGGSTAGTGNVIIASNILEKMVSDPQARQHYEKKIQAHFDTNGEANAFMAMRGRRIVSRGVIIHPNGEVTYYCSSDYTPEEKARLERAMKEEDEAKAKKREEEQRLNEIALNRHRQLFLYRVPQLNILSSNNLEEHFLNITDNVDISVSQLMAYRFKSNINF